MGRCEKLRNPQKDNCPFPVKLNKHWAVFYRPRLRNQQLKSLNREMICRKKGLKSGYSLLGDLLYFCVGGGEGLSTTALPFCAVSHFLSNGFRLSKKHDRYKISKTDEQTFMRDFPLCPEERKSGEAKGNLIFFEIYNVRVRNVICRIF